MTEVIEKLVKEKKLYQKYWVYTTLENNINYKTKKLKTKK